MNKEVDYSSLKNFYETFKYALSPSPSDIEEGAKEDSEPIPISISPSVSLFVKSSLPNIAELAQI